MKSWKTRWALLCLFGPCLWSHSRGEAGTPKSQLRPASHSGIGKRTEAKSSAGSSPTADRNEGSASGVVDCIADPVCRQLTIRANDLSRSNQHAQALDAYEGAYALQPSPYLLANIGRLQYKLGRIEEALLSLRKALAQTPENDAEKRERISRFLAAAETAAASVVRSTPLPTPLPHRELVPIHRRWQLWTGIGVPLVLGIAAVTVGLTVRAPFDSRGMQVIHVTLGLNTRLPER
jgi:tetratricopeptide (TPR) repeat protein